MRRYFLGELFNGRRFCTAWASHVASLRSIQKNGEQTNKFLGHAVDERKLTIITDVFKPRHLYTPVSTIS